MTSILRSREFKKQINQYVYQKQTPFQTYEIDNLKHVKNQDLYILCGLNKNEYVGIVQYVMKQIKQVCFIVIIHNDNMFVQCIIERIE